MSQLQMSAKEIFLAALDKRVPAERAAFVDRSCRGDSALQRQVEALLKAHGEPDSILGKAPELQSTVDRRAEDRVETQIGPYKLLQELGAGGMGEVHMAEQSYPVQRKVAVKIIRKGMDSRQVIARFEAERQALAMMDHPNIARVFDAGTTDSGRPYFVMELVKGVPITQYCDEQRLTPRQRLELFVSVCQGVQHAHQKGIIHRDIKPPNVLVAEYDDLPVPKIIDFGVAKAVGHSLTDKTMFTRFGQIVGTIDYMSPEQAKLNQLDIDTRSDIYALGVLLYELLSGATPFDKERLHSVAVDEMLRIIREEEPPTPSRRLSSSQSKPSVAANRHMEPGRLATLLRGELDWIVMKALEKDRNRRYETASALAADIQRYLADEPVQACPASAAYRFRKFARRNKGAMATAAMVGAALVVGIIGTSLGLASAVKSERKATADRATAQRERDEKEFARADERRMRKVAEEERGTNQRHLYAADTGHFQRALLSGRYSAFIDGLLDKSRPEHTGGEDLRGWEWHHIYRLTHADRTRFRGHEHYVHAAVFNPDGSQVASADESGTVLVWNAHTGEELRRLAVNNSAVLSLAFNPDGTQLAVGCQDGNAGIIDGQSGKPLYRLAGHLLAVNFVAFSGDGMTLVTAGADNTIKLWDSQTGKEIATLPGHKAEVRRVWFHKDGNRLASIGDDGVVRFWDLPEGKQDLPAAYPLAHTAFALNPDLTKVAMWSNQRQRIEVATVKPREAFLDFPDYRQPPRALSFSGDGQRLAIVDAAGQVDLWDVEKGPLSSQFAGAHSVSFSANGGEVVCACDDGSVKVFQTGSPRTGRFRGHDGWIKKLAFAPQAKVLASGDTLGSIRLWDVETGQKVRTLGVHIAEKGPEGAPPPDALKAMEGKPVRHVLRFAPPAGGVFGPKEVRQVFVFEGHGGEITGLAFSPDGKSLASAGANDARIWDVEGDKERHILQHPQRVSCIAFSPDGALVATGCWDDVVRVWDVAEGSERQTLNGHADNVEAVVFHSDSRRLISAGVDGIVRIWDLATGKVTQELRGHSEPVYCLALSPDGRLLASGSSDRTIGIWDMESAKVQSVLVGHTGRVTGLLFLSDRDRLVSISNDETDGMARVWDAKVGREIVAFPPPHKYVNSVAFDPLSRRLAVTEGNYLTMWDGSPTPTVDTTKPRRPLEQALPARDAILARQPGARVLGFQRAKALPKLHEQNNKSLKPQQAEHEFAVVVLSIPHAALYPTALQYQVLQERNRRDPGVEPFGPERSLALYDPGKFTLVLSGDRHIPAAVISPVPWSLEVKRVGFSRGIVGELSTATFQPAQRALIAVAWELPEADAAGPFLLQFDAGEPIPVPNLDLKGYRGMHDSSPRRAGAFGRTGMLDEQRNYFEFSDATSQ